MGSFLLDLGRQKGYKIKFLRMLKGLVPIRDIFLFHEIYILFDFTFIQWITIKVTEIIIVSHFHEIRVKTIMIYYLWFMIYFYNEGQ